MSNDPVAETPEPVTVELVVNGKLQSLPFEQAFSVGSEILANGSPDQAAKIFQKLQTFTDRGPRAGIMRAFCEAAQRHFVECSGALKESFPSDAQDLAATLHDIFVFYHVVSRREAIQELVELVNQQREFPSLCLLLGDMFEKENSKLSEKCWRLAIRRDRVNGAVAQAAQSRISKVTA